MFEKISKQFKLFKTKIDWLKLYGPSIVKYGRFIPNHTEYFNDELGVKLASKNQYTEKNGNPISHCLLATTWQQQ